MANTVEVVQDQIEDVQPYSMHVSSRYLELTQKKLQLTRLPREVELSEPRRWELGTPKAVLEPLLDYWLEQYDWRTQESQYNSALPQYRTTIQIPTSAPDAQTPSTHSLRIHFVHKRSKHINAIPLLFCHTWPSSFIEVIKIIDALTDPHSLPSFGAGAQQAFHVVVPSIPGFGFSDASPQESFGLKDTAQAFDGVMRKLGYERYVAHGSGWGFNICRALASNHPQRCLAVHTTNPAFTKPTLKRSPVAFVKHRIASLTKAKISYLSFGYVPAELDTRTTKIEHSAKQPATAHNSVYPYRPPVATLSPLYALRPQTLSFSLCDSPIGLLAGLLDIIHTRNPSTSPVTSRSRSPFLSPVELEMLDSQQSHSHSHSRDLSTITEHEDEIRTGSIEAQGQPLSPHDTETNPRSYSWSPTEVLNWTMLQWLPGPEASLRWLRRATLESSPTSTLSTAYCAVPLGISSFQARDTQNGASSTPIMFGSASWHIAWVKRHSRPASFPAWEAPDLLVLDMRECFGTFLGDGLVNFPTSASQ